MKFITTILSLLILNSSFAGTITNPTIDTRNNSKTYNAGIGNNKTINNSQAGKVYNDKVVINNNNSKSSTKTDKSSDKSINTNVDTNIGIRRYIADILILR